MTRPGLLLLIAISVLAACSQVKLHLPKITSGEEYTFVPPPTVNGRRCASQCAPQMDSCKNFCTAEFNSCRAGLKMKASAAFQNYVSQQMARGQLVQKKEEDFWNESVTSSCPPIAPCQERCVVSERYCHTKCGGKVLKGEQCLSNCDNIPSPEAPDEPDWL